MRGRPQTGCVLSTCFFFSSRRRHTRFKCDWSSDVCSSDLPVRAASLNEFGWRQPMVVDKHGVIVAGHTRLAAAKQLGLEQVPVHIAGDLTPEQIRGYRLMDNRSNEETSWDSAVLSMELGELKGLGFDMAMTGFSIGELNNLVPAAAGLTEDDAVPAPPDTPVTVLGDCWLCGPHRVLCGDSTSVDAVARLCAPGLANLVFTDPPPITSTTRHIP